MRGRGILALSLIALVAVPSQAAARPDAAGAPKVKYPRFTYRYEIVDFRGFVRNSVNVQNSFSGDWSTKFTHKGGTFTLKNPTRSKSTPNGLMKAPAVPEFKLSARRSEDGPAGYPQVVEECTATRPASLAPEARIYYGPNAILKKPKRVPTNRLEIHWVLPPVPDVSCGAQSFPQGTQPSGRKAFTLTYTLSRFQAPFFQMPFEFHLPYSVPNGHGQVDWRGRLQLKQIAR